MPKTNVKACATPFNSLTAHIAYEQVSGKAGCVSHVVVKLWPVRVAMADLGGEYSELQALKELRRNAKRFIRFEGWDSARALGLVA